MQTYTNTVQYQQVQAHKKLIKKKSTYQEAIASTITTIKNPRNGCIIAFQGRVCRWKGYGQGICANTNRLSVIHYKRILQKVEGSLVINI